MDRPVRAIVAVIHAPGRILVVAIPDNRSLRLTATTIGVDVPKRRHRPRVESSNFHLYSTQCLVWQWAEQGLDDEFTRINVSGLTTGFARLWRFAPQVAIEDLPELKTFVESGIPIQNPIRFHIMRQRDRSAFCQVD